MKQYDTDFTTARQRKSTVVVDEAQQIRREQQPRAYHENTEKNEQLHCLQLLLQVP